MTTAQTTNVPRINCTQLILFRSDFDGIKSKFGLLSLYNSTSHRASSYWGTIVQGTTVPGDNCTSQPFQVVLVKHSVSPVFHQRFKNVASRDSGQNMSNPVTESY